ASHSVRPARFRSGRKRRREGHSESMATRPIPEYAAASPAVAVCGPGGDTFPKLVRLNAERIPRQIAIREKDLGIWQSYTWRDYLDRSRLIGLGLASLGFARGDKVAIIGDNRPELYWAVTACH